MTVRVLIVDDQAPFRLAARAVVEETRGFEVVGEANTGEESIEVVRQLHPDLVLMDIKLPGMDGIKATRRILQENPNGVAVLLLSTYEADEYGDEVWGSGAAGFIPKSEFGPERLAAAWADSSA